ncbi:transporter substrate-binding domain-containing protein [Accumulibacter sp.]|uniref:transporter substrate-binding domain-containing protein n=2 Tax=Accumulibacter sp. TaxID=2053492 RepID=UPI002C7F200E|nr:transporter substrate-binding domain-containing protein [Accumulibacter sp.]HNB68076.1 transporter substrate-binding domain-containing protein [Accumulibacter sp.]HNM63867.1 transporter substrate-binding domain-containing protein [Accumulibacter sp.]
MSIRTTCCRVALLLSMLACCFGLGAAQQAATLQAGASAPTRTLELSPQERAWIAAHPRIVLGIDQDWAPFILKKSDGSFSGIDGDLVAQLNAMLGTRITFVTGRWADMVTKLKNRQVDGLSATVVHAERGAFANFTRPYMTLWKYFYARRDHAQTIRSVDHLAGKRIGYQAGNLFEEKTLKAIPNVRAVPMNNSRAAFSAVLAGNLDGFVGSIMTEYQLSRSEAARLQPLFRVGQPLELVFSIRNDWPELVSLLDKGIAALSAEERLQIKDRYYRGMDGRLAQVTIRLSDSERAWIEAHPSIVMGIDRTWKPFVITEPDGRVSGIEADFLARIRSLTGLNLQIEQGVWKDIVERAKRKEIDGLLYSTRQKEGEPYFLFSDSTFRGYRYIFARKNDMAVYRDMASLAGKRVGYQAGNAAEEGLLRNYPSVLAVAKANNGELLDALLRNQIDGVLSDAQFSYLLLERTVAEVGVAVVPPDSEISLRYSIRNDWPELQAIINKALAAIPSEERLAITERYIGKIRAGIRSERQVVLTDAEQRWLDARHTVRARVSDWPPYMFTQPTPAGVSVDYLGTVARRFGFTVEFVADHVGWSESVRDVKEERRHFDVLLTMHRSPEREKDFALSADYLYMPWAIFARRDSPFISGLDSLRGKTVAAEKGYFMTGKLKQEHPEIRLIEVDRSADALRAVSSERADAYVGNLVNASFLIRELGLANLSVAAPTAYGDHTQAMAVRKDWPELASLINKGIAAMTPDERNAIILRWDPQKAVPRVDYTLAWQVSAGAGLILAVFLYWNRKLALEIARRQRIESELRASEAALRASEAELRSQEADLKASEAELRRSRDAAEAANQAKSMFLASMSHELRTPLNAILGFSEMLARERNATEDHRQKLGIINRSGAHLLAMIEDILNLSKVEAGKTEVLSEPFDLTALLEDVGQMIRHRAETRGISFSLDVAPDIARIVVADAGKLRQILINLLGNAVKFTGEGGVILRARTRSEGQQTWLDIDVEDTGSGIASESLETIFQPFIRGQAAADGAGTGLGLALSRSFVRMMGGRIEVASTPGQGSVFHVELPLELSSADAVAAPAAQACDVIGLADGQLAPRILVVEDASDSRLLVTGLLMQADFIVREAANGEQAVGEFQSWRPDLILMDMCMPVLDGFAATGRIRTLPGGAAVKIVALTAGDFKDQRAAILACGCDAILAKPVRAQDIFATLGRLLGLRYRHAAASDGQEAIPELAAGMLASLPEPLRQALRAAATELDVRGTEAVIEEIESLDPQLAVGLKTRAENYRFSEILALFEAPG